MDDHCRSKSLIGKILVLGFLLSSSVCALAQVVPEAYKSTGRLTAGEYYSYFDTNYAGNRMTGLGAYIDWTAPILWHLGAEAEGRWLIFGAFHDFSQYTYLIGPRYRLPVGRRFQPYAKLLVGAGEVNFPYQLGHGGYFAIAPGGGIDFNVKPRWRLRADYEYQIWPNAVGIPGIPSSALKPNGDSAGISYQIF